MNSSRDQQFSPHRRFRTIFTKTLYWAKYSDTPNSGFLDSLLYLSCKLCHIVLLGLSSKILYFLHSC